MVAVLRSNSKLRKALQSFFSLIIADVQSPETVDKYVMFKPGSRFSYGVWFIESDAAKAARNIAIAELTRILGSVSSDEDENDRLLWRVAAELSKSPNPENIDQSLAKMFDEIERNIVEKRIFISQNHTIRFTGTIEDLRIGPVRAVKTEILETELLNEDVGNEFLSIAYSPVYNDGQNSGERIKPDLLWEIVLTASIKNIKEQAIWMVNVALGIIRIAEIQQSSYYPFLSSIPEANPFEDRPNGTFGLVLAKSCQHFIGNDIDVIQIDDDIRATLMSDPCKKYMSIFEFKKGSVGARVAQGLGWMTRGRQSSDRAERLLYFFTAMESLLTNDDKTIPVTQNIARHASVILAEKPEDRLEIANKIKSLYAARSCLVHAGKRTVTRVNANMMQNIVESTYLHIMSHVDPLTNFSDLNAALAKASYGGPWP